MRFSPAWFFRVNKLLLARGQLVLDLTMFRFLTAALVSLLIPIASAQAGDRSLIGYGRLITDDFIGDGKDRWRQRLRRVFSCLGA